MRRGFYTFTFAILITVGCDLTPKKYPGEPNIHAIISVDSTLVQIMVGRTVSVDDTMRLDTVIDTFIQIWDGDTIIWIDTFTFIPWNGVSGADVDLNQGNMRVTATEEQDARGYYNAAVTAPAPRQTWTLEITYPDEVVISAHTTVPGDFETISPLKDTICETDTLRWTPSQGAAGYMVGGIGWYTWEEEDTLIVDSSYLLDVLLSSDTTFLVLWFLEYSHFDSLYLLVSGLDTNAYDYMNYEYNYWWNEQRIEDYMHIDGAWGVFGSKNTVRSKVFLMEPPEDIHQ
ncbi:DUF4249 family protein [candidate division WOR-3 bacterium]|nr:DUF4249 family protein [candidate division WOR-3 bacterium]